MKTTKNRSFGKVLFLNLLFYEIFNFCMVSEASLLPKPGQDLPESSSLLLLCQEGNRNNNPALSVKKKLGVDIRPIISSEVKQYGLNSRNGVVIVSLTRWSPLTRLGFEKNDMMFEINGRPIIGPKDLLNMLSEFGPQERITIRAMDHRTGKIGYVQLFLP